ncbi:hypothetical protein ACH79_40820 [Bradyrhizobium sp. CCBAU 051011]|uniref:hypothetical protein n=1 Tax=Bradyrhizobium sp. CCBAU 051011 TaxID=858422 RepID=UPI0013746733|nr:hypothetical protein [Bradyrhizobium sp. CCBAU 051011]QHO77989.1 hypothetical protein ACH79_40820 [Bradyrhizobium sp. CCBAU 051011]
MSGSAARSKIETLFAAFLIGGLAGAKLRVTYAIAHAAKRARRRRRTWSEFMNSAPMSRVLHGIDQSPALPGAG